MEDVAASGCVARFESSLSVPNPVGWNVAAFSAGKGLLGCDDRLRVSFQVAW